LSPRALYNPLRGFRDHSSRWYSYPTDASTHGPRVVWQDFRIRTISSVAIGTQNRCLRAPDPTISPRFFCRASGTAKLQASAIIDIGCRSNVRSEFHSSYWIAPVANDDPLDDTSPTNLSFLRVLVEDEICFLKFSFKDVLFFEYSRVLSMEQSINQNLLAEVSRADAFRYHWQQYSVPSQAAYPFEDLG
jgi:hypothetical protein